MQCICIQRGFDENDLYENLTWLCERQERIESRLFSARRGGNKPELFLYDVTSSYLERQKNALGAYGFPRDGKKGKKQIVIGLLFDEAGEPVSTQVFKGNTLDLATFGSQVKKLAECFGCQIVKVVGDRGMIKRGQMEDLSNGGFHYITAITKPEIMTLVRCGIVQMELFDAVVCEVEHEGVRYILRRNPLRAQEVAAKIAKKLACLKRFVGKQSAYLAQHPRARVPSVEKSVWEKIPKLKIEAWVSIRAEGWRLLPAYPQASRPIWCSA